MKAAVAALFAALLLPGCSALSMLGIGATDVLPSLKYCDDVSYVRNQTSMEIHAKCKVPAG